MSTAMTLAPLNPTGTIDPTMRDDITQEMLDQLCEVVCDDAVYDQASNTDIAQCYDGRPSNDEAPIVAAKAAGGTETHVVGRALVGMRYDNETVTQHTARVADELVAAGHRVGGHTADTHGAPNACGCGACDKLGAGLQYIVDHHDELDAVLALLNVTVGSALGKKLAANAANLLATNYVQPGPEIINAIRTAGGSVENLVGAHLEGVAIINTRAGTTLNKRAVMSRFDNKLQAFGVDVWAMQAAAHEAATTEVTEHELLVAMLYHNLAIAAVLCGPGLRVVVR